MKRLILCAVLGLAVPSQAHAQATINGHPADFDQYPSFLEATTHLPGGAETVLRCGYGQSGSTVLPDAGYMETSVITPNGQGYMRYQRIDNKIVVTTTSPTAGRFLLQITEPTGLVSAKNCQMDLNTDAIENCTTAQPFLSAAQANTQDQNAAQQCGTLFATATPKMNLTLFSQQKTDQFKASLRQKVAVLEAP